MKKLILISLSLIFMICSLMSSETSGTPEEAKTLLNNGIALINEVGQVKAFEEFRNKEGKYIDRDLYLFVFDLDGMCYMHPYKPHWEGKNQIKLKAHGIEIIKEFVDAVKDKKVGEMVEFEYKWPKPGEKKLSAKLSYLKKIDEKLFIGCGAYK